MFNNNCWHKWDKWKQEQPILKKEYAYHKSEYQLVQSRTCLKCNYKEIKTVVID